MKTQTVTKLTLTIVLLFLSLYGYSQHLIKANVFDKATKEAMPFVNIGIRGKNIGTTSNSTGHFQVQIPANKVSDSLTFSFVGYHSLTLPIRELLDKKPDSLLLEQKTLELQDVTIFADGKWKTKETGLKRNLPFAYGLAQSDTVGDIVEVAQVLDLGSSLSKVTSFHIYVKGVSTDTASFRLNFYHFNGANPTERAYEREIFFRRKVSNGWMELDLNQHDIWLKGEVVAAIEFLPTDRQKERVSFSYGGIIMNKGISYRRTNSQGAWHKLDFGTYSIYVTTKSLESKNIKGIQ